MSVSRLPEWFQRAIAALQAGDVEGWMEIYAPDAVHEFPFAPAGSVSRLEGRDAIAGYMRRLPEIVRFGALEDVRVIDTQDGLIVEATGHHRRMADDRPVELGCVWVITRKDGLVTRYRDYMNPLQLAALAG